MDRRGCRRGHPGRHWRVTGSRSPVSFDRQRRTLAPGDRARGADRFPTKNGLTRSGAGQARCVGRRRAVVSRVPEGVGVATSRRPSWSPSYPGGASRLPRPGLDAPGPRGRITAGVTGSVGKTGTAEALRHALARCRRLTHASAASHNSPWGVPLRSGALCRTGVSYGSARAGDEPCGRDLAPLPGRSVRARGPDHHGGSSAPGVLSLGQRRSPTRRARSLRGRSRECCRDRQPRQRILCADAGPCPERCSRRQGS